MTHLKRLIQMKVDLQVKLNNLAKSNKCRTHHELPQTWDEYVNLQLQIDNCSDAISYEMVKLWTH